MRNRLAGTLLLLFVFLCTSWAQTSGLRKMIDLSGTWSFALDPHGKGEQEKLWNMDFAETVTLPGTTDSNRKGIENTNKSETTYLSRYYKYEGAAWYSRNIEIDNELIIEMNDRKLIDLKKLQQELNYIQFTLIKDFNKVVELCNGTGYDKETLVYIELEEGKYVIKLIPIKDSYSYIYVYKR